MVINWLDKNAGAIAAPTRESVGPAKSVRRATTSPGPAPPFTAVQPASTSANSVSLRLSARGRSGIDRGYFGRRRIMRKHSKAKQKPRHYKKHRLRNLQFVACYFRLIVNLPSYLLPPVCVICVHLLRPLFFSLISILLVCITRRHNPH